MRLSPFKKGLEGFILWLWMILLPAAGSWAQSPQFCIGDVNGDGNVAITDVLIALKAVVGLTSLSAEETQRGDVNKDGRLDLKDVVRLLQLVVRREKPECSLEEAIAQAFSTSLHATRKGKETWYSSANGGFEQITNIPISQLTCTKCHPTEPAETYQPGCKDCHKVPGDKVADQTCLGCHSRQANEIKLGYSDVHRERGFSCTQCHTSREMHGDGRQYSSWLEPGAMEVACEKCHPKVKENVSHTIHLNTVHCTACHTQSVVSCYNCHFESEVAGKRKRPYGIFRDWVFLLRREGTNKVFSGTLMSLVYQGKTFYALAPYRAHTIVKEGRKCEECHNSPALQEYLQTGKITLVKWDGSRLVNTKGVIPVPPDWRQAFLLDLVNFTGDPKSAETKPEQWVFLKTGGDAQQMLFAQPLTPEQMEKLKKFGK